MKYTFKNKEDQMKQREEWLREHATVIEDVFWDEEGEYVMLEPTLMDDGDEPEDGRMKKKYLPPELNSDYTPL